MQVLKDEMKERIYRAAFEDFKTKGYKNASMQSIAKSAGMTVGNLYRYFKNKETLFRAIVGPAYETAINSIKEFSLANMESSAVSENFIEGLASLITKIYTKHREEFLILLDKSRESVYENAKGEVIALLENRIREMLFPCVNKSGKKVADPFFARVISASFVEGFITILRECTQKERILEMSREFIRLFFNGILYSFNS